MPARSASAPASPSTPSSITNVATTGNSTITSNGLDVEAGMRVNGTDQIQRFDGSDVEDDRVRRGVPGAARRRRLLPADAARCPATTTVDGAARRSTRAHTTLKVKSVADFGADGHLHDRRRRRHLLVHRRRRREQDFTGVTGCTGSSADKDTIDKVTITETSSTNVTSPSTSVSGAQTLGAGNLTVGDTTGFFNGVGTVHGQRPDVQLHRHRLHPSQLGHGVHRLGRRRYDGHGRPGREPRARSSPPPTTSPRAASSPSPAPPALARTSSVDTLNKKLNGITGCTGTPADGAKVTIEAKAPGIYKWDDSSTAWQSPDRRDPELPRASRTSPATNDYFQATKAPSSTTVRRPARSAAR